MDLKTFHDFLDYYEKVRLRTKTIIGFIPPDKMDWTYKKGKFTLADLIRHLGAIERYMYAENVQLKPSRYTGCGKELADGHNAVLKFLDDTHAESMKIFHSLTEEDIQKKCMTPGDVPVTVWKWLRLMAEHEIHHRGQIYLYVAMLGIEPPTLYGLTSEQLAAKGKAN